MANTDKRARKKTFRDERVAQQWAAYRRRRMARLVSGIVIVALVIGGAFVLGGDDEEEPERNGVAATPSETKTPVPPSEETPGGIPTETACGAEPPPPASPKTDYKQAEQVTEEGVDYGMVIKTSCGDITVDFLEEKAPETVNNFVFLAREGYFDGLIFHRIVPDFVVQSGDPDGLNGNPPDGPGYSIKDELPADPKEYVFGSLAMANSGPNTGGSQFFLVVSEGATSLTPDYSLFGQASEDSKDVLLEIAGQELFGGSDPTRAEMPVKSVYIESIEITEN